MDKKIETVTRKGAMELEKTSDTPILDADILASCILGISRFDLFIKKNEKASESFIEKFSEMIKERKKGVPVAYLTNKKDFFEDAFYVDSRVLIPRPESEFIVTEAISCLSNKGRGTDVLDICCGSGCIGLSILRIIDCNLTLSDISKQALEVVKINKNRLFPEKTDIKIIQSDLFEKIDGKFDVITANPPYLSAKDMSEFVSGPLEFEPRNALYGGESGMEITKKILSSVSNYLKPGGTLIVELGYEGAGFINEIGASLKLEKFIKDYNGIKRTAVFSLHK